VTILSGHMAATAAMWQPRIGYFGHFIIDWLWLGAAGWQNGGEEYTVVYSIPRLCARRSFNADGIKFIKPYLFMFI
jgi:hypothetical protein